MANLRLTAIKVYDSTTIRAKFTEDLDELINTSNVTVTSNVTGVPDSQVVRVEIQRNIITITVRPLTPYATYYVEFVSTESSPFKSIRNSYLFEDGKTNKRLILGAEDPADSIRDFFLSYLNPQNNIYNTDHGTVVRDLINSQSDNLSRALHDIGQLKNDNYLSVTITDEVKTRGAGPYDRLLEEGAYQVLRVGKKLTGTTVDSSYTFDEFPSGPISLQSMPVEDELLVAGSGASTFNGIIFTVAKSYVTKMTSLVIDYQDGYSAIYDIEQYGYQLKEPRYDEDYASPFFSLENNQIKLSDAILESDFVTPKSGDQVTISYEYQNLGRVVDESTVVVSQVLQSLREVAPPSQNQFTLTYAPIVTSTDVISVSDGVVFLDPSANPPFSDTHPAFVTELPLRFDRLPSYAGEYSIDYENGRVYVYGADDNDGTGDYPPVATYYYRKIYDENLDYTYDADTHELVANPLRDLIDEDIKVSFSYEEVLVPNQDYVAQIHAEVLDERIDNRLVAGNCLTTENSPITNVFRVFNETTGEAYKITRWNGNRVYFSGVNLPRIIQRLGERASFTSVLNEQLIVSEELINASDVRVLKIPLENNRIMAGTEDAIGSSFNTSLTFSRSDIFETELYFDNQVLDVDANIDRLSEGQYQVDYLSGVIYVAVTAAQNLDLGSVNYKKSYILPENPHVISISNVYHSVNNLTVSKYIDYSSFGDGEILPAVFSRADERFQDDDTTLPYVYSAGTITVTDSIKDVRYIYDVDDLNSNVTPTNFAEGVTVSGNVITLDEDGIQKQEILTVESGGIINVSNITAGAEILTVTSVIRLSDNVDLWSTPGTFTDYEITLNGVESPIAGDVVFVTYNLTLNGSSTPVVDYNRGEYYVDYDYLADEVLVSYEHGDNVLDFRESDALNEGQPYYVTYRVGALRDALLKNFGSLVNLPILNSFDTSLPRESYRDALKAALQSFPKGPTIPAIKSIVSNIAHIEPDLEESAFQTWSLGQSRLYRGDIDVTGTPEFVTGKYDYGMLLTEVGQTVSFPVESNLRLEEGTLEMWVIPEWDGLDNDATLTFTLTKDGVALPAESIYIGSDSHNPTLDDDGAFTVNRRDTASPSGIPSAIHTSTGIFIYYDDDVKRWKVYARDIDTNSHFYSGTIVSSGEVYDVKHIAGLGELSDVLRSGTSKIQFTFNLDGYDTLSPDGYQDGYDGIVDGYWDDGYSPGLGYIAGYSFDGIDFMADDEHYLFDFGKTDTTNRFSLFKDGKGYLNFRVHDKGTKKGKKHQYKVSADISDWESGDKHHVAVTWRLNSADRRDEMHMFIDGTEVPNIMKYGGRPTGTSSDRFRTVKPEYVAGTVTRPAIAGDDLVTEVGSNIVYSESNDFESQGIVNGDEITINEVGFNAYTITSVDGSYLTLSSAMPATLSGDGRFSVNEYAVVVASEIDLFKNITVSVLRDGEEIELAGLRADIPQYSVSKNQLSQNVLTILGSALPGDQIVIRTLGINHRRCRDKQYFWGNETSIFKTQLPPPINLDEAWITALLLPLTSIGPSNSTYSLGQFSSTLSTSQPTNSDEGRTLSIRITGGNVNFSTPTTVTINGTAFGGPVSEILSFSEAGTQTSVEKWMTISSVDVVTTPITSGSNSVGVTIREAYPVTVSEGNENYPVLRYSFKTQRGTSLTGDGSDTVEDLNGYFIASNVGQKLVISSPGSVAETYTITELVDENTVKLDPTPATSFTGGAYNIFNTSIGRSGFQNGYFVLEEAGTTNTPYAIPEGWYEFDYASYLEIPFDPVSGLHAYVGSDKNGTKQAKAVIDELRILSKRLTDVRVGESSDTESITADSIALRPFRKNSSTLMLLHFDSETITNDSDFWITANRDFVQSNESVNSEFGQSLVVTSNPLEIDNKGLFSTASEGTIEFWVSPRYDTYNDPEVRFYFDASGSIVEEVYSTTGASVKVAGRISRVLSVHLAADTTGHGTDYYAGGTVGTDFQTIKLQKALPSQRTLVRVSYIPSGLQGDRISIYKDSQGYITFNVRAQDIDYQVRQPVFWARDSWHRVQATYKLNRPDNRDELRLFVDGEERGIVTFGSGLLFGQDYVFGQGFSSVDDARMSANIDFTDSINNFYIGSDYMKTHTAYARIDNLRLSNEARRPLTVAGQPKDVNYSDNLDTVYPVVSDGPTTYLFNFDATLEKAKDFTLLKDERFGIFDFTLNIIDSFGIVSGNAKIKQVLEILIRALKPAQSRVQINYIDG